MPTRAVYRDSLTTTPVLDVSSANVYKYTAANGVSRSFTVTMTPVTFRTNFQCGFMLDGYINDGSVVVPTKLSFPDGSSLTVGYELTELARRETVGKPPRSCRPYHESRHPPETQPFRVRGRSSSRSIASMMDLSRRLISVSSRASMNGPKHSGPSWADRSRFGTNRISQGGSCKFAHS
jgi:hypothetical protein